jgi:hypothetical protein
MEKTETTEMEKEKKKVEGQRKWEPEKKRRGNTRKKIQRGGHKQKR